MRSLLDVNVLIALLDPHHVRHGDAHAWFQEHAGAGWATCPLTENGVVRVLGHQRYPGSAGSIETIANLLSILTESPHHAFWADDITILDDRRLIRSRLGSSSRLTDAYLLALAVKNAGRLVTFDRRLSTEAVVGGHDALLTL
jgi:uncharacterized protein